MKINSHHNLLYKYVFFIFEHALDDVQWLEERGTLSGLDDF